MKKIVVKNNETKDTVLEINVKGNLKDFHKKVKTELSKIVGHEVRMLPQGSIDCSTGRENIRYLTFGTFGDIKAIEYKVIEC